MAPVPISSVRRLGSAIRDARLKAGATQAELARAAGVSRQWLISVEKGNRRAEAGLVLDVLRALDLSLAVLPSQKDSAEEALTDLLDELDGS